MSTTKVVLATAALAVLAVSTEARPQWSSTGPFNPNPRGSIFEEEYDEQGLSLKKIKKVVNKAGHVAGKVSNAYDKAQQIGVLEEGWEAGAGISGSGGKPSWNVGIKGSWDDAEEQGLSLKKVKKAVNKVGHVAGKVSNAYDKAQQIGVLEEDAEEQGLKLKKIKKAVKTATKIAVVAGEVGLLEEDAEEQGLSLKKVKKAVNKVGHVAGKVSNAYDKAQQIGVLEEEYDEQKFKISKALKKATKVIVKADELGLLEEEAVEAGLSSTVKKSVKFVVAANELGLLEDEAIVYQSLKLSKALNKVGNVVGTAQQLGLLDEEEAEEQGLSVKKIKKAVKTATKVAVIAGEVGLLEEDAEEQGLSLKKIKKTVNKVGHVAGKVSNAYDKAQQIGVLEEEEWEAGAGISSNGGKPQWNAGISHKWEEESPIARRFGSKFQVDRTEFIPRDFKW